MPLLGVYGNSFVKMGQYATLRVYGNSSVKMGQYATLRGVW